MRLVASFVIVFLGSSSTATADMLAYGDDPVHFTEPDMMSLSSGLLDRMQLALARLSITTELGSHDGADTATSTLHAQVSTSCDCTFGAYFTLPFAYALAEPTALVGAGATPPQRPRAGFGTADVGLFLGAPTKNNHGALWRIGALLPTAPAAGQPHTISARAGDMVLELPRSAGARFSASHLFGFMDLPNSWFGTKSYGGLRIDTGLDLAYELDRRPEEHAMHVVPHAGLGAMIAFRRTTVSLDTVLAMDPTDTGDMNVRWSTGITTRFAPTTGLGSWFQPGLTLAMVRTPDGWGGTIALEIAATRYRNKRDY
jgi:hypothetical protein